MIMKIFWKEGCPHCPKAKELGKKLENKVKVEYHNIEDAEGLAEALYYGILSTPSMIALDEKGKTLKEWKAEIPKEEEIKELVK